MDKQLLEEFNKMYLSKSQLEKRIYNKEELEEVWNEISSKRKNSSVSIDFNIKDNFYVWFNIVHEIKTCISYIDGIKKSEVMKYIDNSKWANVKDDNNHRLNNTEYFNLKNIEDYYKLHCEDIENIYIESCTELKYKCSDYEHYKLNKNDNVVQLLEDVIKYIVENKSCDVMINSAILYFYIVYLNPFKEFNFQMAQYITNEYLVSNGYEIIEHCKIYELIESDQRACYMAIKNSIKSEGDITYFIKYYLSILKTSVNELVKYVGIKYGKKIIKELIEKNKISLEEREIKFINNMIVLDNNKISIEDYKKKTKVSYETARSDLNELVALGFFKIGKSGKKYEYYFNDIATIIDNIGDINIYLNNI